MYGQPHERSALDVMPVKRRVVASEVELIKLGILEFGTMVGDTMV